MDRLDQIRAHFERSGASGPRQSWPDNRGEFWAICPFHGDRHPDNFSFSERGYSCFACGASGGLGKLAQYLEIAPQGPYRRLPERTITRSIPTEKATAAPLVANAGQFQPIPVEAMAYYQSRGFTRGTLARWQMGYGVLPRSRCRLPRLVLPVYHGGKLVALRGRWIEEHEACSPDIGRCKKWMQSSGSSPVLFGQELLRPGVRIIVTEAPWSAILAMQKDSLLVAVAGTAGAGHWEQAWTDKIRACLPRQVIVWLDNDEAGRTNAVKIANQFLAAGRVATHVYRWPAGSKAKADLADVVQGVA